MVNTTGTLIVFQGSPKNPLAGFRLTQLASCSNSPFTFVQIFLRDLRNPASKRTFVASARLSAGSVSCGNQHSIRPSITTDGSRIVFSSSANNLVTGDNNGFDDIFFVDVAQVTANTLAPILVSLTSLGSQADSFSEMPMITSDGMHVAFLSFATNLAEEADTNQLRDIFVRHLELPSPRTQRLNMDCTDEETNNISSNPDIFLGGRGVVYESDATNLLDPSQDDPFFNPPTNQQGETDFNGVRDVFESRLKPRFVRGDADLSGEIDITDPIFILQALFTGGPKPECLDAADANDIETVNMGDAIYLQLFMFLGGPPPPAPFSGCGFDLTDDCLSCRKRGLALDGSGVCPDGHAH